MVLSLTDDVIRLWRAWDSDKGKGIGACEAFVAGYLKCYYGEEDLKGYVYKLEHLPSGGVYVGSSTGSLTSRFADHIRLMKSGTHYNSKLLEMWSGEVSDWCYQILEDGIETAKLREKEYDYCQQYRWITLNLEPPKLSKKPLYRDIFNYVEEGHTYRQAKDEFNVSLGTVTNAVRSCKV